MPEELSPESKLYLKEELEKVRKEFKEELKEAQSKSTKIFSTVAMIVGLLTALGVYYPAKNSIKNAIDKAFEGTTIKNLEEEVAFSCDNIKKYEVDANDLHAKIASYEKGASDSYNNIIGIETNARQIIPVGTIIPYGGEIVGTKPGEAFEVREGWFFCNGARLKRVDYAELYNVVGDAFGAPDSTAFNLPDLRGRFVRGVDHGAGNDPNAGSRKECNMGGNIGDKVGSIQEDEFGKHQHQVRSWGQTSKTSPASADDAFSNRAFDPGSGAINESKETPSILNSGGSETRPKNVYVNWIIKAQ